MSGVPIRLGPSPNEPTRFLSRRTYDNELIFVEGPHHDANLGTEWLSLDRSKQSLTAVGIVARMEEYMVWCRAASARMLHYACFKGDAGAVKDLTAAQPEVNRVLDVKEIPKPERTVMRAYLKALYRNMCGVLCDAYEDDEKAYCDDFEGDVRCQLEHAADYTPLHLAVPANSKPIITELLKAGADLRAEGPFGFTPLVLSAACGPYCITELLLRHPSVDVDARGAMDTTALWWACARKDVLAAKVLLDAGADFTLEWARKKPLVLDGGVAALLEAHRIAYEMSRARALLAGDVHKAACDTATDGKKTKAKVVVGAAVGAVRRRGDEGDGATFEWHVVKAALQKLDAELFTELLEFSV